MRYCKSTYPAPTERASQEEANALNRPISYTRENEDGTQTVITADYDYMGRRVFKKAETVTTDSESGEETRTVLTNHRFLYRGYLQIDCCDLTRATLNELWFITWDPTEPVATRPLAIQKGGTWYTAPTRPATQGSPSQVCSGLGGWLLKPHPAYGLDLPKNITEVHGTNGGIKTAYTYTPYGLVTSTGSVTQPLQWSSEYADTDLALVYYNYRHYNPTDGRWTGRDPKGIIANNGLYTYTSNQPVEGFDYRGTIDKYCKKCQDNVEFRKSAYNVILDELKYRNCELSFKCEKRSRKNPGATTRVDRWYHRNIKIVISLDCCKMAADLQFDDIMGHELVHARDLCRKRLEPQKL